MKYGEKEDGLKEERDERCDDAMMRAFAPSAAVMSGDQPKCVTVGIAK